MNTTNPTMAQQVAVAASEFQRQLTGHNATSVTAVQNDGTLVVTLLGALTPAEKLMSQTPEGAMKVQEFHRLLFSNSCEPLRQEIKRITGVEVCEATAQLETTSGTVIQVFTTGIMVQVFLLTDSIPPESWTARTE